MRRLDILVQAEQVVRVVLALQRCQPLVLRAEGFAHHVIALLLKAGEVEIAAAIRIRLQGGAKLPHPGDIGRVVRGIFPVCFGAGG